jgi:hypothetical protein
MRFRKLRIAWSVVWGIACVLLIVSWARSYTWGESYSWDVGQVYCSASYLRGAIVLRSLDASHRGNSTTGYSWGRARRQRLDETFPIHFYGFYFRKASGDLSLIVPMWLLIIVSISCAAAPWLAWKFSVRTLLTVMTVVAAVLGIAVWLSK